MCIWVKFSGKNGNAAFYVTDTGSRTAPQR